MLLTRRAFVRLTGGLVLAWVGLSLRPKLSAEGTEDTPQGCDLPAEPAIYPPIVWEVAPDVRGGDLPAEPAIEPPIEWESPYDAGMALLPPEPAIEPPIVWEQAGCTPAGQSG